MNDFEAQHPRDPRGTSSGGRFAPRARSEAAVSLPGPAGYAPGVEQVVSLARLEGQAWANQDFSLSDRDLAACQEVPEADGLVVREEFFRPLALAFLAQEADGATDQGLLDELTRGLSDFVERERRWHGDETFTPPGQGTSVDNPTGGPVVYHEERGSKYTGLRDVVDVAKDVRRDIRDAQRAGFLPEQATFRVRCQKFAGGQSMHVVVGGMSDEEVFAPDRAVDFRREYRESARLVRARVEAIAGQYNRTDTDAETDFFDRMFFCHVDLDAEPERSSRRGVPHMVAS